MRKYVVQAGDTPATIAIRFAGCPKCAIDLVRANPHKPSVRFPNGFQTFRELRAGERIDLPDKWFSGALDGLPSEYFAALPHPDGVTPPKGRPGLLGDYAALDDASMEVSALASRDDRSFSSSADSAAGLIDSSVSEAYGSGGTAGALADTVYVSTARARKSNVDLQAALNADDKVAATAARLDVQNSLSVALGAARVTLQVFYSAKPPVEIEIGPAVVETPAPAPSPAPAPAPAPVAVAVTPPEQREISTGAMIGLGLLGVGAVGSVVYIATQKPFRRRRVRRVVEDDRSTC